MRSQQQRSVVILTIITKEQDSDVTRSIFASPDFNNDRLAIGV